ncbi:MAG: DUF115 domain-containing protein [Bacteroidales bacterium]|nr:DUF115 domain-containing protein [Lachnoclostridium sp.]MCM1383922.1 DUF115 domain-containing protein [Lachnoclostridium sp.]MCM1464631.1 DUF115 domain-containing protein [Bacteroidales bacterium]
MDERKELMRLKNARMITQIQETIYYLRIQDYAEGSMRFNGLLQMMQEDSDISIQIFAEQNSQEEHFSRELFNQMMQALERTDMLLLADLLEEALLPLVKGMVIPMEPDIRGNYCLESTSSGYLTVRHIPTNLYLHGNCNPMEEARYLVEHCFESDKENYAVWGIGLGYHVVRLYEAAKGAISITIFDEDEEIFELAAECGILDNIPRERLSYVVDKTGEKFLRYLSKQERGILLHFPSVKKIQEKQLKERINRLFLSWNDVISVRSALAVNFRSNQKYCNHLVDEIEKMIYGREVVLVAAGPSLDDNLDFLKKVSCEKVIMAVARVWKKLLYEGIVPDYAVTMDAHEITLGQLVGVDNEEVPLIVDSTAYWEMAASYGGEKYIAYQKDYGDAEKCAKKLGCRLYETGGSVLTLCLDIVLQLGAKVVYFAGADLSYPGRKSYANGTMDSRETDISGLQPIEAVDGNIVYADYALIGFRKWIEDKIKEYPQVEFYNLSSCGAKIIGAQSVYDR